MSKAQTSAYYPNHSTENFGLLDEHEALAKFDDFPWSKCAREAAELEQSGVDCVDADLTFRIDACHLTARTNEGANAFNLEVCVPPHKLLGLFDRPEFYSFDSLSANDARESLRVFLTQTPAEQHIVFRRRRTERKGIAK